MDSRQNLESCCSSARSSFDRVQITLAKEIPPSINTLLAGMPVPVSRRLAPSGRRRKSKYPSTVNPTLNKYAAFFEKWFLLRTRLRRTRGEAIYRSRRFGFFLVKKSFSPPPDSHSFYQRSSSLKMTRRPSLKRRPCLRKSTTPRSMALRAGS